MKIRNTFIIFVISALSCFAGTNIVTPILNGQLQSDLNAAATNAITNVLKLGFADGSSMTTASSGGGASRLAATGVKTANYNAVTNDFIPVDTTSGAVTVTFPTAPADKSQVGVKKINGGNLVNLALGGSDVFNKAGGVQTGSLYLTNQSAIWQYSSGPAIWYAVTGDTPLTSLWNAPQTNGATITYSGSVHHTGGDTFNGSVTITSTGASTNSVLYANGSDAVQGATLGGSLSLTSGILADAAIGSASGGKGTNTSLNGLLLPSSFGGSLMWTNAAFIAGSSAFTSPQDSGSGIGVNTGHGSTHGNGVEWFWVGNQLAIAPTDGNHIQLGAAGTGTIGIAGVLNYNNGGNNANYTTSDFLDWNLGALGFWGSWAETYNFANPAGGGTMLHFTVPDPTGNADYTSVAGRKALLTLDSDNGVEVNGYTRVGYSVGSTAATNCAINITNGEVQEFDLTQSAYFYITNLNYKAHYTNTSALRPQIVIYSGPGGAQAVNFTSLTSQFANTIWASESGITPAPTNIPAATVMWIQGMVTVGAQTNAIFHYMIGGYSPTYDASASSFFTATGIVDASTRGAINAYVLAGKAHGWWTQMDAIYPFTGPNGVCTSTTATWNLIATNKFPIAWTAAGSGTFNITGAAGDGATVFGDTGMNPNTASSPNYVLATAIYGVYSRYNYGFTGGGNSDIGAYSGSGSGLALLFSGAGSGGSATSVTVRGPNSAGSGSSTYGIGFEISQQLSGNNTIYSGPNNPSGANSPVSVPNTDFYVCAQNNGGLDRPSTNSIAIAFIGGPTSGAIFTSFTNDTAIFLQSEGRY